VTWYGRQALVEIPAAAVCDFVLCICLDVKHLELNKLMSRSSCDIWISSLNHAVPGACHVLFVAVGNMIGCTILRAVSVILRTHRGWSGSGLRGHLAGANATRRAGAARAGLVPASSALATGQCRHSTTCAISPLNCVGLISPRSPLMWPCSPTGWAVRTLPRSARPRSSPLLLTSSPVWLASLSPGRRWAVPTSHWPWASSRAAHRRAGSQCPYRHCRLRRRAVGRARAGTAAGRSPTAPCTLRVWRQRRLPLPVRVQLGRHRVADRQRRAASPVSGIPD
jgi:hypothetical protein